MIPLHIGQEKYFLCYTFKMNTVAVTSDIIACRRTLVVVLQLPHGLYFENWIQNGEHRKLAKVATTSYGL